LGWGYSHPKIPDFGLLCGVVSSGQLGHPPGDGPFEGEEYESIVTAG
jgi:hypothetical protein